MLSYEELLQENERLKNENQGLQDLVAQLRRKQYGKSSEKVPAEQLGMFDEVETEALNWKKKLDVLSKTRGSSGQCKSLQSCRNGEGQWT